jgi:hypothetical protein
MSKDICDLLFEQVSKPSDFLMCKPINLYDNRYRINVYSETEGDGLLKRRISQSYFTSLSENGQVLHILGGNEPVELKKNNRF